MGLFRQYGAQRTTMVSPLDAVPDRSEPIEISGVHFVNQSSMVGPFDDNLEIAYFALGCFWGAERIFWQLDGVYTTAVGYQGGFTKNPTYDDVCTTLTGHAQTVMVVFDPEKISFADLARKYFEGHDPTQVMRQGNDVGTEYRSAIFATTHEQFETAQQLSQAYDKELIAQGYGPIATEIKDAPAPEFYYAEEYHQQYLAKNPGGYCGLGGTGVSCPVG
jgi:peptide-methionine (S)-S-oxide reductase